MREYRVNLKRFGRPVLAESQPEGVKFQSLYEYPQEVVDFINKNGNTQGLKGKPVISDTLFIDVDEQENVKTVIDK